MNNKTQVMFRIDGDGEVLAVFPHEVADFQGNVTCYAKIGQHHACNYGYILEDTKPAKEGEYSELFTELVKRGYDLELVKKRNYERYLKNYYGLHNIKKSKAC
jgi:hypothetical protein